jgi:hypothetical protein
MRMKWGKWKLTEPGPNQSLDFVGNGYSSCNPYWILVSDILMPAELLDWKRHLAADKRYFSHEGKWDAEARKNHTDFLMAVEFIKKHQVDGRV